MSSQVVPFMSIRDQKYSYMGLGRGREFGTNITFYVIGDSFAIKPQTKTQRT
jgi:hypothetical protein